MLRDRFFFPKGVNLMAFPVYAFDCQAFYKAIQREGEEVFCKKAVWEITKLPMLFFIHVFIYQCFQMSVNSSNSQVWKAP